MAKLPGANLGGEGMEQMPKIEPQKKAETENRPKVEKPKKPGWFKRAMGVFSEKQAAEYVEQLADYVEKQENVGRAQAEEKAAETMGAEAEQAIRQIEGETEAALAADQAIAEQIGPDVAGEIQTQTAELSAEAQATASAAEAELQAVNETGQELPRDPESLQAVMKNLAEQYNKLFEKSLQEAQNLSNEEKKVYRRALKTGNDKEINALPDSPTMQELKMVKARISEVENKIGQTKMEAPKAEAAAAEQRAETPVEVQKTETTVNRQTGEVIVKKGDKTYSIKKSGEQVMLYYEDSKGHHGMPIERASEEEVQVFADSVLMSMADMEKANIPKSAIERIRQIRAGDKEQPAAEQADWQSSDPEINKQVENMTEEEINATVEDFSVDNKNVAIRLNKAGLSNTEIVKTFLLANKESRSFKDFVMEKAPELYPVLGGQKEAMEKTTEELNKFLDTELAEEEGEEEEQAELAGPEKEAAKKETEKPTKNKEAMAKFEPFQTIKVQRTDGSVEGDWKVISKDEEKGEILVMRVADKKRQTKTLDAADLLEMQNLKVTPPLEKIKTKKAA